MLQQTTPAGSGGRALAEKRVAEEDRSLAGPVPKRLRAWPVCAAAAHRSAERQCQVSAKSGHRAYSITSSAVASSDCGMVRPISFAVLRLITSSNLVGACTGMSAGFSPLRMRLTYPAAR